MQLALERFGEPFRFQARASAGLDSARIKFAGRYFSAGLCRRRGPRTPTADRPPCRRRAQSWESRRYRFPIHRCKETPRREQAPEFRAANIAKVSWPRSAKPGGSRRANPTGSRSLAKIPSLRSRASIRTLLDGAGPGSRESHVAAAGNVKVMHKGRHQGRRSVVDLAGQRTLLRRQLPPAARRGRRRASNPSAP